MPTLNTLSSMLDDPIIYSKKEHRSYADAQYKFTATPINPETASECFFRPSPFFQTTKKFSFSICFVDFTGKKLRQYSMWRSSPFAESLRFFHKFSRSSFADCDEQLFDTISVYLKTFFINYCPFILC